MGRPTIGEVWIFCLTGAVPVYMAPDGRFGLAMTRETFNSGKTPKMKKGAGYSCCRLMIFARWRSGISGDGHGETGSGFGGGSIFAGSVATSDE